MALLFCGECAAGMKDSVHAYILLTGIKHPEIVLRQAILETGWFQSKMLMKNNNLFAFRRSKKYMRFDTWQESIDYYKSWQDQYYTNPEEDYYAFLKRKKYAHTPEYIKTLKNINLAREHGSPLPVHVTSKKTVKQTTHTKTKTPTK